MRLSTLTRRPSTAAAASYPLIRPAVANIAHRGASAYAPENTLAALRKAVARDADLVEFDLHRTRDGALVLLHDPTLDRTTDARLVYPGRAPWRVVDFTYDELTRLDAGSWKAPEFAGERIPTLADALEVLRLADVGALVELKTPSLYPGIARDVADTVRAMDACSRAPRVTVQSFDADAVREVRQIAPALAVGLLGSPAIRDLPAIARWADHVNPHHRLLGRAYVDRVHELGLRCSVWTVNRTSGMRRAIRLGVDGVITDRPDLLHRVRNGAPVGT